MAEIQRSSKVVWEGTITRGAGLLSANGGAFTALPVTIASRFQEPEGVAAGRRLGRISRRLLLGGVALRGSAEVTRPEDDAPPVRQSTYETAHLAGCGTTSFVSRGSPRSGQLEELRATAAAGLRRPGGVS